MSSIELRTKVSVVVQTHWDREWYLPHQAFIARLLHVMPMVADQLEAGELESFLFDGQTAAMEDLLANCEPELGARVRRLVRQQRIILGPWYVMADQFLSSGEALLRNLEIGIADATALGNCQRVGYLPDTFGHIAQMPQLLRNFAIGTAVLWRGVDSAHSEFDWRSPDGSVAGTVFLTQGYYQHPFNTVQWQQGLGSYLDQVAPRSLSGQLLLTQGGDHLVTSRDLAARIAQFNQAQSGYQLVQDTLAGHVDAALGKSAGRRATIAGELRQNGQAFVLPDVLSTRRYLKKLNQEAEDRLLGVVEPLLAHLVPPQEYPAAYLEQTWRLLIQQQAHDSICGCSTDAVHEEMQQRYVLLQQRMDALVERACAGAGMIALSANAGGGDAFADDSRFTLFNPLPHRVDGWQEFKLFLKGEGQGDLILQAGEITLEHVVLDVEPHQQLISPLDDFPDMLQGYRYTVAVRHALDGNSATACTATRVAAAPPGAMAAASIENDGFALA
jgi:mannosylglycerate hydrolase